MLLIARGIVLLTSDGTNKVHVIYLTFQLACSQLFNMQRGKQGMKLLDLLVVDVEATEIGSGGPPSLSLVQCRTYARDQLCTKIQGQNYT